MVPGFLTSKPFVIGAVIAMVIVATGAVTYSTANSQGWFGNTAGCEAIPVAGGTPGSVASELSETNRHQIAITFPPAPQGGAVTLCVAVGEIVVSRGPGETPQLTFTIRGPSGAVESTVVETLFSSSNGKLVIGAWESVQGRQGSFGSNTGSTVTLDLVLPDGLWDLHARTDVGNIRVSDLRVGTLRLGADVGSIVATSLISEGNTTAMTDVGSVTLEFESVQTSQIKVSTDVDAIEVRLPQRADVGYKVHAQTDVGEVDVDIGATENFVNDRNVPGAEVNAQTKGYDSQPTQVQIEATADVGDILVKSP